VTYLQAVPRGGKGWSHEQRPFNDQQYNDERGEKRLASRPYRIKLTTPFVMISPQGGSLVDR
jgi:hypothetical protein